MDRPIFSNKKKLGLAFIIVVLAIMLAPFALQSFGIRSLAINLDAKVYRYSFAHSITDQVVLGKNGWQYYGGEMEHYLNRNPMSERSLKNIAHNVKLVQDYYEAQGAKFVATIAPNKSSLYDENMPYYYKSGSSQNASRIEAAFKEAGVNYVNLFSLFEKTSEVLYFDKDSHWNDKGAALVADALAKALGNETQGFATSEMIERKDFAGDIEKMINTIDPELSTNYYVAGINDGEKRSGSFWSYTYGSDVEDGEVDTVSNFENKTSKTLLMYRDSFANNLLPFMATKYANATFTKMIPYASYSGADSVILERSERQIHYLCEEAPLFESSQVDPPLKKGQASFESALPNIWTDDDFVSISNFEVAEISDEFYVQVSYMDETFTYSTFWLSNDDSDFGWQVNLNKQNWQGKDVVIEVLAKNVSGVETIHKYEIKNLGN